MIYRYRKAITNMFLAGCFLWLAGFSVRDDIGHCGLATVLVITGVLLAGSALIIATFITTPTPTN